MVRISQIDKATHDEKGGVMSRSDVLRWWLDRGFELLPSQFDSKFLLAGYGQHKKHITTLQAAEDMFLTNRLNISVYGPGDRIILDFDDVEVYKKWCAENRDMSRTYTEVTPRGGRHVFMFGRVPVLLQCVPGVELKRICLVAPSTVNGVAYIGGTDEILEAKSTAVFSSLSKVGSKTAYALNVEQDRRRRSAGVGSGVVERIKREQDIERVFSVFVPDADLSKPGRYVMVNCPFHADDKPSMFLDRELQIFRCHGCGAHGDVINLYARFTGKTNTEAIRVLARLGGG